MEISIRAEAAAKRVTIELKGIDGEACKGQDFYPGELPVQKLVAAIGQELTKELMVAKDETAGRIEVGGTVYYPKSTPRTGHYKTLYGEMAVARHRYPTAPGGERICPMEQNCRLERFGSATPLLARGPIQWGAYRSEVSESPRQCGFLSCQRAFGLSRRSPLRLRAERRKKRRVRVLSGRMARGRAGRSYRDPRTQRSRPS